MASENNEAPPRLLIDLGNTRLKWVLQAGSRFLHEPEAVAAEPSRLPWSRWRLAAPVAVALAAVAPPSATASIVKAVQEQLGLPVGRPRVEAHWHGLHCAYAQPERLGVDRWLALLAAHHDEPAAPALVISAGTALTVDRLDPAGRHRGGGIAPGLATMREGLFNAAPGLAGFDQGKAGAGMAADSADAIASGCLQAALGLVERTLRQMAADGHSPRLWLSGGDAPQLAAHLHGALRLRPWLVLEGLAIWSRISTPPRRSSGID